jgi:hypothetical protein
VGIGKNPHDLDILSLQKKGMHQSFFAPASKLNYYSGKGSTRIFLQRLLPGSRIRTMIIDNRFNGRKFFDKITGSRHVHIRTIPAGLID